MMYGQYVVTMSRRPRYAHMVTDAVNGGVRTACGMPLREGAHRPAPDGLPSCGKCGLHSSDSPDRKRFTKYAIRPTR